MAITVDEVRQLALSLPETEEKEHWGKPSFRVRGKVYAVIQEDYRSVVVKTTQDERLAKMTMEPDIYSLPDSFQNLNYMKVRIDRMPQDAFRAVLLRAWQLVVPKRVAASYDGEFD